MAHHLPFQSGVSTKTPTPPPGDVQAVTPDKAVQAEQSDKIRRTLEDELRRVKTPDDAERIVAQLEQLAAGKTEGQQGDAAARDPATAAIEIGRAAAGPETDTREAAAVIAETAQQTISGTPNDTTALDAAQKVLSPAHEATSPEAASGATLLQQAVLRRLGPLGRLDARLFLAINNTPHTPLLDRAAHAVALSTNGGWIWSAGLLVAKLFGVRRSGTALAIALPSIALSTWIVEYPAKAVFRRQRPFIDVVRAMVVGKKPGSWSFPSGHSAAAFGGAWVLTTVWPRAAPFFFTLASIVGFSRIYVGAHYPGDVTSGAFFGMTLAEISRRGTIFLLRRYAPQWL